MKKIFVYITVVIIIATVVLVWRLLRTGVFENNAKQVYFVPMNSPGCFLPKNNSELLGALTGLKQNTHWHVIPFGTAEISQEGWKTYAYRICDVEEKVLGVSKEGFVSLEAAHNGKEISAYLVALISTPQKVRNVESVELTYKATKQKCGVEPFQLEIHRDFKMGMRSCLIYCNDNYGLLLFEMGSDDKREFTKNVFKQIPNEIKF